MDKDEALDTEGSNLGHVPVRRNWRGDQSTPPFISSSGGMGGGGERENACTDQQSLLSKIL